MLGPSHLRHGGWREPRSILRALPDRLGMPFPEDGRPGDPGLFGPGSAVWRIGRERVLLLAGGAALLMQLAHPLVAAGVAEHSGFDGDPFRRLRRTLDAVLTVSFGDTEQAIRAAERVGAIHAGVRGRLAGPVGPLPAGAAYSAGDPSLALWVHATLVWAALEGHARFVAPLPADVADRYLRESGRFAALFGVSPDAVPAMRRDFQAYLEAEMLRLHVAEDARRIGSEVLRPPLPAGSGPASRLLRLLTAGLLPPPVRDAYGLPWSRRVAADFDAACRLLRATVPRLPAAIRYWPHWRHAIARSSPSV